MTRQSVSKHLAVPEAANVVTTVRRGRGKLHYLSAAPISDIADRWIDRYGAARVRALPDLKLAPTGKPADAKDPGRSAFATSMRERAKVRHE
jgi:hypothetical protein